MFDPFPKIIIILVGYFKMNIQYSWQFIPSIYSCVIDLTDAWDFLEANPDYGVFLSTSSISLDRTVSFDYENTIVIYLPLQTINKDIIARNRECDDFMDASVILTLRTHFCTCMQITIINENKPSSCN
jgi:hypothetical protein